MHAEVVWSYVDELFFIILPIDLFYLILKETSLGFLHVVKQKLLHSAQMCACLLVGTSYMESLLFTIRFKVETIAVEIKRLVK